MEHNEYYSMVKTLVEGVSLGFEHCGNPPLEIPDDAISAISNFCFDKGMDTHEAAQIAIHYPSKNFYNTVFSNYVDSRDIRDFRACVVKN